MLYIWGVAPSNSIWGFAPNPTKNFFGKKFLDFKKLLSVETCGFDKVNEWMSWQKTKFFAVQSS
jgi:hypothetical protein